MEKGLTPTSQSAQPKDDGEYNKSEELGTKRRKIIKDDEHNLELVAAAEEEDRISKLPQVVVVRIVSLLTLKEAAATSILSRRWRTDRNTLDYFYRLDENILNQEGRKYVNWVNRVLEQHIEAKESSSTSAGLAMEKRVQVLQLDLLAEWANYTVPMTMRFPTNY
ncbi:unnamed protein product [Prunus armeniaca]